MSLEIETIDLGNGCWWQIKTVVSRGMRKQLHQATLKSIPGALALVKDATLLGDREAITAAVMANADKLDLASMDMNAPDDAMLLAGTHGWSWPEPVTLESIDARPETVVNKVLERMRVLYAEASEEEQKKDTARP